MILVCFQVSIEFGLSEMLNTIAIKPEIAPKDGKFDFMISDLEAMFPDGMVDHNVEPVYKEVIFRNFSCLCSVSEYRLDSSSNDLLVLGLCSDATMGRDCGKLHRSVS